MPHTTPSLCPHCGGTHTHTDADGTLWQCQDCYAGQYAPQAPPRGRPRMLDLLTEYKAYWQDVPLPYYHSGWRYGGVYRANLASVDWPTPLRAALGLPGRGVNPWVDFLVEQAQTQATAKACRSQFTDLPYHEHEAALEQAEQLAREATWRRYTQGPRRPYQPKSMTMLQWLSQVDRSGSPIARTIGAG
jgi:hypothetical protein